MIQAFCPYLVLDSFWEFSIGMCSLAPLFVRINNSSQQFTYITIDEPNDDPSLCVSSNKLFHLPIIYKGVLQQKFVECFKVAKNGKSVCQYT